MNHDVAHCADYSEICPDFCHYVKLNRDLKNIKDGYVEIGFAHFLNSACCPRSALGKSSLMDWLKKIEEGDYLMPTKCCDNCIHYHWYYDHCDKYECEVDVRSVCSSHERSVHP